MKKLPLVLSGLFLLGLGGCSRTDGPWVNLVTVHFKDATVLETTCDFVLRLSNESPSPQKFTGSSHRIYINDLFVGNGLSDQAIEVQRLGTVTQAVTVHLSNLALATRIKSVIEKEGFEYRVQSRFFGQSVFDRSRSETSGKLDLKDFTTTQTNAPAAEMSTPAPSANPNASVQKEAIAPAER